MAYDPYTGEYTSPSTSSSSSDGKLAMNLAALEQYSAELKECKQLIAEIRNSLKKDIDTINTEWDSTGKDRAYFLENMGIQIDNIKFLNEAIETLHNAIDEAVRETRQTQSNRFQSNV